MEIKGKIISVLPLQTGSSAKGQWKKQEFILQTEEQYPKKICFNAWGDKIDEFAIRADDSVEVSIDIESREFNGRWYTDVKAWKVVKKGAPGAAAQGGYQAPEMPLPPVPDDVMDDMPF
jgi:hypothetical protein